MASLFQDVRWLTVTLSLWSELGLAILGAWIPARRAAKVDPMAALHYE